MNYTGICVDGPKDGQRLVWDRPLYQIAKYPPLPEIPDSSPFANPDEIKVGTYKWDRDRWIWDNTF